MIIPVELRQAMNLVEGERLIARVENGRRIMERRGDIVRRRQGSFANRSTSPVDELLGERRAEAERE